MLNNDAPPVAGGADIHADGFADIGPQEVVTVIGIGRRLAARLIDTALLGFLSLVLIFLSLVIAILVGLIRQLFGTDWSSLPAWVTLFAVVAGLAVSCVYYVVAWSNGGQTLGDTLLRVKIVTVRGAPPNLSQAILRYVGYVGSAIALSLGFLWIAFDRKRQGWHDKLAGTVVIPAQQHFSDNQRVIFVAADRGADLLWVGAWVVLAVLAPVALSAGIVTLGPSIVIAVNRLAGG